MSENSNISWTTNTWNPWHGCRRVSLGCLNCYMFAWKKRLGQLGTDRRRTVDWKKPLKWNLHAGCQAAADSYDGHRVVRPRIFPSLCDWLDDEVPIEWLADFLKLIHETPNLDWLLLTKRPGLFFKRLAPIWDGIGEKREREWVADWTHGHPPHNVKIGVSVENQNYANIRILQLLAIPAQVRFLSVEPLLEPVKLGLNEINYDQMTHGNASQKPFISWLIVGGESSKERRDCGVEAIIDVAQQGLAAGCAVHVKQDCAFKPGQQGRIPADIWKLKAPCP